MSNEPDQAVRDPRQVRDERQAALAEKLWDHAMAAMQANLPSKALSWVAEEDLRAAVHSLIERLDGAGLEFVNRADGDSVDPGEQSDGFHTINEYFEQRKLYNAALFYEWTTYDYAGPVDDVHKSRLHHDGTVPFDNDPSWFIVSAQLPTGQISNHYRLDDWDLFDIPERDRAAEFDGHTAADTADRLRWFLNGDY